MKVNESTGLAAMVHLVGGGTIIGALVSEESPGRRQNSFVVFVTSSFLFYIFN